MFSSIGKVSVIIATYNRAKLLPFAIESVLNQTYTNYELIIVDDGSSDNTKELVERYKYHNPKIIQYYYKENGGCASARNKGIEVASGDYISFLDSDDMYESQKLMIEVGLLTHNPSCGFVFSDSIEYDEKSNRIWIAPVAGHHNSDHFAREHFLTNHARPGSIMYTRRCIDLVVKYDESLKYNEDSDFLQRASILSKGIYSQYPSSRVRRHEGSKSRNAINLRSAELLSAHNILESNPEFAKTLGMNAKKRIVEIEFKLSIAYLLQKKYNYSIKTILKIKHPFLLIYIIPVLLKNAILSKRSL